MSLFSFFYFIQHFFFCSFFFFVIHSCGLIEDYDAVLNLCFSYTSRNEITDAVSNIVTAVKTGELEPEDVDEHLLEQSLFLCDNPDMLVRTSGEYRFSDFLLWQAAYSLFLSTDRLWPALKFIDLFFSILMFQRDAHRVKQWHQEFAPLSPLSSRAEEYVRSLRTRRLEAQLSLATSNPIDESVSSSSTSPSSSPAPVPS